MNLILDVGNTLHKLGIFDGDVLIEKQVCQPKQLIAAIKRITEVYPKIQYCIISSVGTLDAEVINILQSEFKVHIVTHQSKVPFINRYTTPTTLGVDRIALITAAAAQYPIQNVLVIDAGSAITYDFITDENSYLGGAIAPGIKMRYKALYTFTANLPLLEKKQVKTIIGNSTAEAMHSGVSKGVLLEIDGAINEYKQQYADLTIILTGGDVDFLRDRLKNDIFANSNFLLEGLNYILEHNKD